MITTIFHKELDREKACRAVNDFTPLGLEIEKRLGRSGSDVRLKISAVTLHGRVFETRLGHPIGQFSLVAPGAIVSHSHDGRSIATIILAESYRFCVANDNGTFRIDGDETDKTADEIASIITDELKKSLDRAAQH